MNGATRDTQSPVLDINDWQRDGTPCPPVLVMNPFYSGLAIARRLMRHGVPVYALFSDPRAPGRFSRAFAGEFRVPDDSPGSQGLVRAIRSVVQKLNAKPVIFPTRDLDIRFLSEHRDELAEFAIVAQADDAALAKLTNKHSLAQLALSLGLCVPSTLELTRESDIERLRGRFRYPVVLKPTQSYEWRLEGAKEVSQARKAIIVANELSLIREYRALSAFTPSMLIQEYIEGGDDHLVICGCYAGAGGELVASFTARKLLQNPPLTGTGCLVRLESVPQIVAQTSAIVRAVGYRGLAEAEFKLDERDSKYYLIEINTRHWDQHELGVAAGVELSWLAYKDAIGMAQPDAPIEGSAQANATWVAERELANVALRELWSRVTRRRGGVRSRFNWSLVRAPLIFGILRLNDPVPGIVLTLRMLAEWSRSALKMMLSRTRVRPDDAVDCLPTSRDTSISTKNASR